MSEPVRRSLFSRFFNGIWSIIVWCYRLVVIAVILLFILGFWFGKKGSSGLTVEDNVALVIAPSGELMEQIDIDPAQKFAEKFNGQPPSQTLLRDLITALDTARDDKRIPLAVVKLDDLSGAGLAQLEELNAAIDRFKAKGKPVYAFANTYEQAHYFVAAHATEVSLDPLGAVTVEGLSSYQNYFKDALDKLGVTVNVFRVGEYKSAVEPFLRNDMSEEAKAANRDWMSDLWTRYGTLVGTARELPADAVSNYVNGFANGMTVLRGDAAKYAEASKLVTHIETLQTFRQRIAKTVRMDADTGSFRQIYFGDYLRATRLASATAAATENHVGLVVVQGEIVDGDGQPGQAGGDSVSDLLDQARRDDNVQAVVLRVNSPGGSVFASEQIRRGVQALRDAGKPVVASMSSVAASGGYWVSMASDKIVAHESTITGSIGIFGIIPTFEGPLTKLGVHTDGVATTSLAGSMRIDRPLSAEVKTIVQASIDKGYRDFINGVATGRNLPPAAVDKIARGRVWSGLKAKQLGLVDSFGGLDDATKMAASLAKLQEGHYSLQEFTPESESPLQSMMRFFGSSMSRLQSRTSLTALITELKSAQELRHLTGWMNDPRGAYARCFCAVNLGFRE